MALLFEKCEAQSIGGESNPVESFDADIQAFVRHQEKEKQPFFSDDEELDALVTYAFHNMTMLLLLFYYFIPTVQLFGHLQGS